MGSDGWDEATDGESEGGKAGDAKMKGTREGKEGEKWL